MTALRWSISTSQGPPLKAHEVVKRVVDAFRDGSLPGRLPYKLRTVAPLLLVNADLSWPESLARGLLSEALDGKRLGHDLETAVMVLWEKGYKLNVEQDQSIHDCPEAEERAARISVNALQLCRYLAGHGTEGNDERD